jgi:uncharacterized protein (DUF58 family)
MDEFQAAVLTQLQDSLLQFAFVLGTAFLLAWFGKAQPARRLFLALLLPVLLLGSSVYWPWLTTVVAIYTPLLMLIALVDGFYLSVPVAKLSLSRAVSRKLSIGQSNAVLLTLINNSGQAVSGMIRDSVPVALLGGKVPSDFTKTVTVAPYSREAIQYAVMPNRRGLYRFDRIHFRYRSRLGLLWMTLRDGRPDDVKVVPDLRLVRRMRLMASRSQTAGELQKRALGLEGTQFSGLRHYFAGDDIRKMAWQATAKLDIPVVRTYAHEVEQPVLVLLEAGRKMALPLADASGKRLQKYDWALNSALAFMAVAVDRGDCVGAGVFSNQVIAHVPLGSGRNHLNRMLETLGESEVQLVEPDYEAVMLHFARQLKRRALVVIFTDLIDPLASRNLLRSLYSFARTHLIMIVTPTESELIRQGRLMPEDAEAAYRKGVAQDLLALRQETLRTLRKTHSAIVVDAPPEGLDDALLRQYLQIKQKNRL